MNRRRFLRDCAAIGGSFGAVNAQQTALFGALHQAPPAPAPKPVPVIDITDLYHPHQDVGDNIDLLTPYSLPAIDLRAVILDVTDKFRQPTSGPENDPYRDDRGPREAGFIPVLQLNALFGRDVPAACGPFSALQSLDDTMDHAPAHQQAGVELLLSTLRQSQEPVDIVSFGSARPLAVAYNRDPALLGNKVRRVHLCAGASPPEYLEWNVMLDKLAFIRLLRSDLPVAIYPCATDKGPFDLGPNNSYWLLNSMAFVQSMHPALSRYILYALERSARPDFLRFLENPMEKAEIAVLEALRNRSHHVWETAVWAQVASLRIARRPGEPFRLIPSSTLSPNHEVIDESLTPCRLRVSDEGQFAFEPLPAQEPARKWIYHRQDPLAYQTALQEAFPALYQSFKPPAPL